MTRAEFCAFLREHDNFVILTHRRPDGDTIGCASALCLGLRQLGKSAASFAAAISSGKLGRVPVFSPSSRRTDWIIHRPMMFFR